MPSSTTIAADAGAPRRVRKLARRLQRGDQIAHIITFIFAATIFIITALLFYELYRSSSLTRDKFGWSFLTKTIWDPVALEFGALPFIYGTLVTSALSLIIGVPLGVGAAIFLAELAPLRVSNGLAFIIELLAAVPSVIYGLLAIFTLVPFLRDYIAPVLQSTLGFLPFFQGQSYGVSLLAGGSILAIMVLPFIISISREVLLAVPREQREASLALGATQWETTWNVVVPYAKAGIVGPFSWHWPARWEKRWPSRWSSGTIRRSICPCLLRVIPLPQLLQMNSPKPQVICISRHSSNWV